ncbi:IS3 family transposase [Paenibacillus yanchengensis]|uniref:IS3 family transposase n=1 Tax=Paenibacillus yanchengensis TaxID=2035833 RepID=UPI003627D116
MPSKDGRVEPRIWRLKDYRSYEELKTDIDEYMKFYNEERYQEKLNSLAPLEFRHQAVA